MKKKKLLLILLLLIALILLPACQKEYTIDDIREIMEEALYEKYGEEFVVDRIGKRTANRAEFYQARIYPKSIIGTEKEYDSYYYASASVDVRGRGELSGVADTYGEIIMNQEAEEYLEPHVYEIFGERVLLNASVSYSRLRNGSFIRSAVFGFEEKLQKSIADPDNIRLMLDLDVYIFKRIEDEEEKEERREQIFEFVQYLKEEGLFEYLEMRVFFIDERVLAPSYNDFAKEIRVTPTVTKEVEGQEGRTVQLPPMELRERMSRELQKEVDTMSEEDLLAIMKMIRKSDFRYEGIRKNNNKYMSYLYSRAMIKERYPTSYRRHPERVKDYKQIVDVVITDNLEYVYSD